MKSLVSSRSSESSAPQKQFFGEVRTRILFVYSILLILLVLSSIPISRALLFARVEQRAAARIKAEQADFQAIYQAWQAEFAVGASGSNEKRRQALKRSSHELLSQIRPADNHFHLLFIDDQLYAANPSPLLPSLQPSSANLELYARWQNPGINQANIQRSDAPEGENFLYAVSPLMLNEKRLGTFVIIYAIGNEREEAIASIQVFALVTAIAIAIAFGIAWLATGWSLRPIKALALTTQAIKESDLSQRIPSIGGGGELADLVDNFNAMMDRMQASFESQRNFMNDAGHELRTPITIIQGHLELMGDDPTEKEEIVALSLDELDRMNRMVHDMLLLAKAEQPNFLQLETIDLKPFMEELFAKVQTLGDRQWQITLPKRSRQIIADRQRLSGALINLLQNAIQHSQVGDEIELGLNWRPPQVHLWVRDTGEGIAPSEQTRIFERFSRVSQSFRKSEGSGLGLAIVRAICEAHGGSIQVKSNLKAGSTFTLQLPIEPRGQR